MNHSRSRILSEVHETATAMYRSGTLDQQTMREFAALAVPQVRDLSPKKKFGRCVKCEGDRETCWRDAGTSPIRVEPANPH
jgi:hypothetical protein